MTTKMCEDCTTRPAMMLYEDCGCGMAGSINLCLHCLAEYNILSDRGLCDLPYVEFI